MLAPSPERAPLNITFTELRQFHFRYVTTENLPHLFCGHTVREGSSYCEFHHARCWTKPRRLNKRRGA